MYREGSELARQYNVVEDPGFWPWLLLPMRLILFLVFQGLIALIAWQWTANPWTTSISWWPFGIIVTNIVTVVVLIKLFAAEGNSYFSILRIDRTQLKSDLLPLLGLTFLVATLAVAPNILLANLLFGSVEAASDMFIKTLPFWAASVLLLTLPVTIALAELPFYMGYIMPRLEQATGRAWLSIVLPAFFLSAQHITMPLIFDWRFVVWRLLMFVPLTLFLAIVIRSRPRLLPYFAIVHGLMDVSLIVMMF
jgi:membrane protease YdiL (CAAX protease family)